MYQMIKFKVIKNVIRRIPTSKWWHNFVKIIVFSFLYLISIVLAVHKNVTLHLTSLDSLFSNQFVIYHSSCLEEIHFSQVMEKTCIRQGKLSKDDRLYNALGRLYLQSLSPISQRRCAFAAFYYKYDSRKSIHHPYLKHHFFLLFRIRLRLYRDDFIDNTRNDSISNTSMLLENKFYLLWKIMSWRKYLWYSRE